MKNWEVGEGGGGIPNHDTSSTADSFFFATDSVHLRCGNPPRNKSFHNCIIICTLVRNQSSVNEKKIFRSHRGPIGKIWYGCYVGLHTISTHRFSKMFERNLRDILIPNLIITRLRAARHTRFCFKILDLWQNMTLPLSFRDGLLKIQASLDFFFHFLTWILRLHTNGDCDYGDVCNCYSFWSSTEQANLQDFIEKRAPGALNTA